MTSKMKPTFIFIFEFCPIHIRWYPTSKFMIWNFFSGFSSYRGCNIRLRVLLWMVRKLSGIVSLIFQPSKLKPLWVRKSWPGRRPWRLSIESSSEIGFSFISTLPRLPESKFESMVTSSICQRPLDGYNWIFVSFSKNVWS